MLDYEYSDEPCPACGHFRTHYRRCEEVGCDDGFIDESEEEFCNPGSVLVRCETCHGTGLEKWCPSCGADLWEARERQTAGMEGKA